MKDLLEEAGVLAGATHIWATGADGGTFQDQSITAYQKDFPLAKALAPEVLVAWAINDRPLSAERGGPVRLVVPGFYGTNSVKWLTTISVADRRAASPFTTRWYNDRIATNDGPIVRPVWAVAPDSAIVGPDHDAVHPSERPVDVKGWAWGEAEITSVDVSHDGGGKRGLPPRSPRESITHGKRFRQRCRISHRANTASYHARQTAPDRSNRSPAPAMPPCRLR